MHLGSDCHLFNTTPSSDSGRTAEQTRATTTNCGQASHSFVAVLSLIAVAMTAVPGMLIKGTCA